MSSRSPSIGPQFLNALSMYTRTCSDSRICTSIIIPSLLRATVDSRLLRSAAVETSLLRSALLEIVVLYPFVIPRRAGSAMDGMPYIQLTARSILHQLPCCTNVVLNRVL